MIGFARLALLLFAMFVGMMPMNVAARPVAVAETCHAAADIRESYAELARQPSRWRCDQGGYRIDTEVTFLRFLLRPGHGEVLPASLVTNVEVMERMDLMVLDRDGTTRQASLPPEMAHRIGAGPLMAFALPPVKPDSVAIVARIVRPWTKTSASEARLDSEREGTGWSLGEVVAMAAICGMLFVPLLMSGGFYAVLPQRYVLWHMVLISVMLAQALANTGFIYLIFDVSIIVEGTLPPISYGLLGASMLMFAESFLEPECVARPVRIGLHLCAVTVFAAGITAALPFMALRSWGTFFIYDAMGLTLVMLVITLVHALRRGSRLVWYQIFGWTPIILVGLYRIARYVVPAAHPTDAIVHYELALSAEAIISSIGILSRLVVLRRERDSATALAQELEGVAGRDPLTGLWNRRSIEQRFADLFDKGFRTMAVLDLDHFKLVNDQFGHGVGDEVLKAASTALAADVDTRAVRIGGEEFLLLLRGPDAAERAERCRRAITTRVASGVPGLDRFITASMGLVEQDPRGALRADFVTLYAHCDRLLYEAKRLGRNRTMRERLTSFSAEPAAVAIY